MTRAGFVRGFFLALLVGLAAQAGATQRIALVIGNGSYKEAPLANPLNDARAMAQALRDSGFTVITRENADQRSMVAALREFGDRLKGGGTGIFYFAGHGMQIRGRNYLVPIGANVEREDEVAYGAVDAQAVLDKMEAAGNGMNIMILDACRNNPFARSFRSGSAGLAAMDAPVGTLVAFATAPGAVASDGDGANGLYTQHLLSAMRTDGAKVEDVFKRVRANVRRDSGGKQVPWEATSLEGDFYFRPPRLVAMAAPVVAPAPVAVPAPAPLQTAAMAARPPQPAQQAWSQQLPAPATQSADPLFEEALWVSIKDSSEAPEFRAFLEWYPAGRFSAEARARIAAIEARPAVVQAAAAPRPSNAAGSQSNPRGFTVGDRWRYQVVDRFKGEVVANWSYRVDKILDNGDMIWNGGNVIASPEGNFRKDVSQRYPAQDYSTHWHLVPQSLQPGTTEKFSYVKTFRRDDGFEARVESAGTLTVKAVEKIRVPAGEFEVVRIEREATDNGRQTNGTASWFGRVTTTIWYSAKLRGAVARDDEYRPDRGVPERRRIELTSYEVSGAQTAQR